MKEEYKYDNLGGNIIGFIPIGILLPLLFISLRNFWKATFVLLVISLLFETTQLITGIGIFDIDDIILNTVGGMIGYLLCLFIIKFSRT